MEEMPVVDKGDEARVASERAQTMIQVTHLGKRRGRIGEETSQTIASNSIFASAMGSPYATVAH